MKSRLDRIVSLSAVTMAIACSSGAPREEATGKTATALETVCSTGCFPSTSCDQACWNGEEWKTCGWWGICFEAGMDYCANGCGDEIPCDTPCVFEHPGGELGITTCLNDGRTCAYPPDPPPPRENGPGFCRELFQSCNTDFNCCSRSCSRTEFICKNPGVPAGGFCTFDGDCSQAGWQRICVGGVCQYGCRTGQPPPLPPCP